MTTSELLFATLDIGGTAPIEELPFEILQRAFSYFPREDRLATSGCNLKVREINKKFTWKWT